MSAVVKILDRVAGVKQTAPSRWISRCPAHVDKSPSFSIREMEDGRVLLHCFAGCANSDVLAAMGLGFSDLFEQPLSNRLPPIAAGWSARELLELNAHEANVVALLAADAQTRALTPDEAQRLAQSAARLARAQGLVRGR